VKASIHAVLGKCGVIPEISDIFGPVGSRMLDALVLPEPYGSRVASQPRIIATLSAEIAALEVETVRRLKDNPEYRALLTINGVGPVMAAIFVAEIGDVHRFATADQLACWTGLTTRVDSSDKKTRYGHVSKQGSRLLRWAAVEGCQRAREPYLAGKRRDIIARRGKRAQHIATVAAARHMMKVVYYTMRDGRARCLDVPLPSRVEPAPTQRARGRYRHGPALVGRGRLHVIDPAHDRCRRTAPCTPTAHAVAGEGMPGTPHRVPSSMTHHWSETHHPHRRVQALPSLHRAGTASTPFVLAPTGLRALRVDPAP